MKCPACGGDTKVVYNFNDVDCVARYRKCKDCRFTFYTMETESEEAHNIFKILNKKKKLASKEEH